MTNLEGPELDVLVSAFEAGVATPEQQREASWFLKPAALIISQLSEPLLEALLFEDPKSLWLLDLQIMTKHGVMTLHEGNSKTVPS